MKWFLVLWTGQLLSGVGTGMSAFALGVHVFRSTGMATAFAMVVLCLFVPSIVLKPVGGVLADRYDRRWMIIIGDVGAAAGMLFVLAMLAVRPAVIWPIYVGIGVSSAFSALQNPAYKAAVTDLLTPEQFSRAGGLVQLAASAQHLVSPAAAGLLMGFATIGTVLVVDMVTFGFAVVTVMAVGKFGTGGAAEATAVGSGMAKEGRTTGSVAQARKLVRELRDGWRAVTIDRRILQIVLLLSMVTFFVGFVQTLFGPMVLTFTDARTLGTIQSVSALGMVATSLVLGLVSIRRNHYEMLLFGLAVAGVSLAVVGATTRIVLLTVVFFVFFAALPLVNTGAEVLIRTAVANDNQGRAWGIIGFLSQIGYLVAYLSAGFLADHLFEPLLAESGALAASVGRVIGVGPGRGMGFVLALAGISLAVLTAIVAFNRRSNAGRSAGDRSTRSGAPAYTHEVIR
ncbi:MAG TPA: MFS transporter [Alkalispirochaeta sp.]|nr:MFS transporter [Alkalispirochaeta sp.]